MDIRTEGAKPFKLSGGPIIPVIACAIVIWLMTNSTQQEFLALAAMLAVETVIFFVMRARTVTQRVPA
jgi:Na+/melibiose symporter-like transporter